MRGSRGGSVVRCGLSPAQPWRLAEATNAIHYADRIRSEEYRHRTQEAHSERWQCSEEMADLVKRAKGGDDLAAEHLSSLTLHSSELWDLLAGLARQAKASWFALVTRPGDGALDRQSLERRLTRLQSDLAAEGDSRIEALLIDRILIAWIAVNHSDMQLANAMEQSGTTREIEYLERQQERTQQNLLRATQSLATLRRLRPPAIQFNADEPQISVAE